MDLTTQRARLAAPNPILAQQAVVGIFHHLQQQHEKLGLDILRPYLEPCLSHSLKGVVNEAVDRLCSLVPTGHLDPADASDLLLSSLPTANPPGVGLLAQGLCKLQIQSAVQLQASVRGPQWTRHPLAAAVLLLPSCAGHVLASCIAALKASGAQGATAGTQQQQQQQQQQLWQQLEPFFAFVLLQASSRPGSGTATASLALLPAMLHSQLVRLGCCCRPLARPILRLLMRSLEWVPLATDADRLAATQRLPDLMDLLESTLSSTTGSTNYGQVKLSNTASSSRTEGSDGEELQILAGRLCATLLSLAGDVLGVAEGPASSGGAAAEVMGALQRLHQLMPGCLPAHAPILSLLAISAEGQEKRAMYALLYSALTSSPASDTPAPDKGLMLYPVLGSLAFGANQAEKAWSSQLLMLLQRTYPVTLHQPEHQHQLQQDLSSEVEGTWYDELCLLQQARRLTRVLWGQQGCSPDGDTAAANEVPAFRWLASLTSSLQARHKQRLAARSEAGATPFTFQPSDVKASALAADARPTTTTTLLLASLLAHPHPAVVAAAAGAVRHLLLLMPQTALYFLPLVLYCLQQSTRSGSGTSNSNSMSVKGAPPASQAAADAQAALLSLLPAMAADASNAPFALRALQPLLGSAAPPLIRCMGLRLMVDIWRSSGKGWVRAEAALSAFLPPGAAHAANPPLPLLRVTRAALCSSVCEKDPHAGVQLVAVLQDAATDTQCPPAAALGLSSLSALCQADVLDFYKAWKVIHRSYPTLPKDDLTAAAWVELLAGGALDAEAYPEKAAAVVAGCWSAARHSCAMVRRKAYTALHAYPLDVLERIESLEPLICYVAPLLLRASPSARAAIAAAEEADGKALTPLMRFEMDPSARDAAEKLAVMALRYEHVNRRRYFIAAAAAAKATPASGGPLGSMHTSAAAAAPGPSHRDIASITYRLTCVLPATLSSARVALGTEQGGGNYGGRGSSLEGDPRGQKISRAPDGAVRVGGLALPHPSAGLLCYRPKLPSAGHEWGGAGAKKGGGGPVPKKAHPQQQQQQQQQRQQQQLGEELVGRMVDGLHSIGTVEHQLQPPTALVVQTWATFFARWLKIWVAAPTLPHPWTALHTEWDTAKASVLHAAPLAAVGFMQAAAQVGEAPAVEEIISRLQQQIAELRSSAAVRAALLALAHCARHLHATDHPVRQSLLHTLQVHATVCTTPAAAAAGDATAPPLPITATHLAGSRSAGEVAGSTVRARLGASGAASVAAAASEGLALMACSCVPLLVWDSSHESLEGDLDTSNAAVGSVVHQGLSTLLGVVARLAPSWVSTLRAAVAQLPLPSSSRASLVCAVQAKEQGQKMAADAEAGGASLGQAVQCEEASVKDASAGGVGALARGVADLEASAEQLPSAVRALAEVMAALEAAAVARGYPGSRARTLQQHHHHHHQQQQQQQQEACNAVQVLHALLVGVAQSSTEAMGIPTTHQPSSHAKPTEIKAANSKQSTSFTIPGADRNSTVVASSMQPGAKVLFCAACCALPITATALEALGVPTSAPPPSAHPAAASAASAATESGSGVAAVGGSWQGLVRLLAAVAQASGPGGDGELRAVAAAAVGELSSAQGRPQQLLQLPASAVGGTGTQDRAKPAHLHPPSAAHHITDLLCALSSGDLAVSKGSHTVLVRAHAARALGCMLAGAQAQGCAPACTDVLHTVRGDVVAPAIGAGGSAYLPGGLLEVVQAAAGPVKKGIRALEAAAAAATAAGVSGGSGGVAAWALAAVCATAVGEAGGSSARAAASDGNEADGAAEEGVENEELGREESPVAGGTKTAAVGGRAREGGELRAVHEYPADGALRNLVEALLELSKGSREAPAASPAAAFAPSPPPTLPLAAAASILRCLAAAPRLPALDFLSVCRRLLNLPVPNVAAPAPSAITPHGLSPLTNPSAHSKPTEPLLQPNFALAAQAADQVVQELQLGVVGLALSHGSEQATGLPGLVNELLMEPCFKSLSPIAQAALLQRLPHALACLAPSQAAPLLKGLSGIVSRASASLSSKSSMPAAPLPQTSPLVPHPQQHQEQQQQQQPGHLQLSVSCAFWEGLANVLVHTRTPSSSVVAKATRQGQSEASFQTASPTLPPSAATAAAAVVAQVYPQLPPLPVLLPGEIAQLLQMIEAQVNQGLPPTTCPAGASHGHGGGGGGGGQLSLSADITYSSKAGGRDVGSDSRHNASSGAGVPTEGLLGLWASAMRCLLAVNASGLGLPNELTSWSSLPHAASPTTGSAQFRPELSGGSPQGHQHTQKLRACQIQCLLVLWSAASPKRSDTPHSNSSSSSSACLDLSFKALAPCRSLCIEGGNMDVVREQGGGVRSMASDGGQSHYDVGMEGGGSHGAQGVGSSIEPLLAAALAASAPQAAQAQVLMETLRQAEVGAQPLQPLQLAAALAAAFHASSLGLKVVLDENVTLASALITTSKHARPSAALNSLHSLPYTLPRLLASPSWAGSHEAVVSCLVGMLANLDRPQGQQQQLFAAAKAVVLACLCGLRNVPPTGSFGIQQKQDGGSNSRGAVADMVYETAATQITVRS